VNPGKEVRRGIISPEEDPAQEPLNPEPQRTSKPEERPLVPA